MRHAEELRRYLSEAAGRPLTLRMNDNLHSLITTSRDGAGPGVRLSLHRMFLQAEGEVLEALAQFITKPTPDARRIIRSFINTNRNLITEARGYKPPRNVQGSPRGRHYELESRARTLNDRFFGGKLQYGIIWGRGPRVHGRQCHVTLGTWNERQKMIRIHPMMDHPHVPSFFLDFVIYHEMVHILVPSKVDRGGRMQHHTDEFYEHESRFPLYAEANRWEKRWLPLLIRSWQGGAALPPEAAERAVGQPRDSAENDLFSATLAEWG